MKTEIHSTDYCLLKLVSFQSLRTHHGFVPLLSFAEHLLLQKQAAGERAKYRNNTLYCSKNEIYKGKDTPVTNQMGLLFFFSLGKERSPYPSTSFQTQLLFSMHRSHFYSRLIPKILLAQLQGILRQACNTYYKKKNGLEKTSRKWQKKKIQRNGEY